MLITRRISSAGGYYDCQAEDMSRYQRGQRHEFISAAFPASRSSHDIGDTGGDAADASPRRQQLSIRWKA